MRRSVRAHQDRETSPLSSVAVNFDSDINTLICHCRQMLNRQDP